MKTVYIITQALEVSHPEEYKPHWNFKKALVWTTGKIPRGKAKAPKPSQPTSVANEEDLKKYLSKAEEAYKSWDKFAENQFFPHPYFGHLNVKNSRKMLDIHTKHHLKIVQDILK